MTSDAPNLLARFVNAHDLDGLKRQLSRTTATKEQLDRGLICALGNHPRSEPIARLLLQQGANPEHRGPICTVLQGAAMNGNLPVVRTLIEFGANPNRKRGRETALAAALSENQTAVVTYLESINAAIDPSLELLYAAKFGDLPRARKALAAGAKLDVVGGAQSWTPLEAAAGRGHAEMVEFLLTRSSGTYTKRQCEMALYDAAAHARSPAIVNLLARAGVSPDAACWDETALMAAARNGDLETVRCLLELGANPMRENEERHMTALDYAIEGRDKRVIALLTAQGVIAQRQRGRLLARLLSREYGGRVIEHSHGFLLNARFMDRKSQFHIHHERSSANVFGLKYRVPEFRGTTVPFLVIAGGKPGLRADDPSLHLAAGASQAAGFKVYSSLPKGDDRHARLTKLCLRLAPRFRTLLTDDGDQLHVSQTSLHFAWRIDRFESVQPRLRLFAALIDLIVRPPQPERRLFDREWLIAPAVGKVPGTAAAHLLGGSDDSPVRCPTCDAATNPIIRLDLGDPQLPSNPLGREALPVRWCLACSEWSPAFFPLTRRKSNSAPVAEPTEPNLPARTMRLSPAPAAKRVGRKSKLGGSPAWLQQDETPDCTQCEKPMAFALQMKSDARISYGDLGMLYAFVCPECRLLATVVQSH